MVKHLLFFAMLLLATIIISPVTMAASKKTFLVLDMRNRLELPRNLRSTNEKLPEDLNDKGFRDLHIIGSGQFSKLGLKKVLRLMGNPKVSIIDLRQESHGFLNGNAISWYGSHNADNSKLAPDEIEARQAGLLDRISREKEVTVFKIINKTDDEVIAKVKPVEFAVREVISEPDWLDELKIPYHRVYVQDFHAPNTEQVDRFVEVVKNIPKDHWIYFHCRAGRGRTTLSMTMVDILRNAKKVKLETIIKRNFAIGGKDLSQLPEKTAYKYKASVKRLEFLKKFHEYARQNKDNYETAWSSWLKKAKSAN